MLKITMLLAMSLNGVIGHNGTIPWKSKGDLRWFKQFTMGKTLLMGRKTWESLGSKPLPGRRCVILSSTLEDPTRQHPSWGFQIVVVRNIGELLFYCQHSATEHLVNIGGASLYENAELWGMTEEIMLTRILTTVSNGKLELGDAYDPAGEEDTVVRFREALIGHTYGGVFPSSPCTIEWKGNWELEDSFTDASNPPFTVIRMVPVSKFRREDFPNLGMLAQTVWNFGADSCIKDPDDMALPVLYLPR